MILKKVKCDGCNEEIEITSFRTKGLCPKCKKEYKSDGFSYQEMNMDDQFQYTACEETDCPVCRSTQMLLDKKREYWKCIDCEFTILEKERENMELWFCDNCNTFLNIQDGFSSENKKWKCLICDYENDLETE